MARGHTNLGQRLCPVSREMGKGRNKCQGENQIQDLSESLENVPGARVHQLPFCTIYTFTVREAFIKKKKKV